ncbi:YmfQ family protein [Clostridium tagluense]|uniref:YmfQ family protein n=1 Tax=Clostridium tagluense TaxID=360422 RepID=UPI001CF2D218|nr:YmfQ family protein [Clostridium tagluense]MCB2310641.1 YmfQ family protein [Clostridium tagluense]MCB2315628.1 YmfQ family protein [Clostridium tagluense]MCB2320482.1 YmfQ family protein [Clostridium tagluense]MCB2325235.1 YmfQ family protein [Clostridium tagluense]MCB2330087.1 YmfQ family protein [Clostridium tagluense]
MYGSIKYGTLKYAVNNIYEDEIKLYTPDLMKYLPPYYKNSKVMRNIQESNAKEIGKFNYSKKDLLDQLYVDTATWGLNRYEKDLGIETDLNKSYEDRREIIKAKKRGSGTATKKMIKNVAQAFSGGEVDIIEMFSDYSFLIQFIGIKGIPKNMQGLIDMIETIKPAHLGYSFKYTYTVWNFLSKLTWQNNKTWNDLKVYE